MIFILAAVPKCFYAQDCDSWSILFPLYYFPSFLLTRTHSSLSIAIACSYVFSTNTAQSFSCFGKDTLGDVMLMSVVQWTMCSKEKHLRWENLQSGMVLGLQLLRYGDTTHWEGSCPPFCLLLL